MDPQELVTGLRWELLKRVSSQPASGSELAQILGTSQANITQHLKLLELAGLVTKERVNGKSVHYRLAQEAALLTLLADPPMRVVLPINSIEELELRLLAQPTPCSRPLRRFLLQYEDLIKQFVAFGITKETEDEVQLLVVAEDVKPLRKEYANISFGTKKIIIWSHTPGEMEAGVATKEHYFIDMLNQVTVLYDPAGQLQQWKEVVL